MWRTVYRPALEKPGLIDNSGDVYRSVPVGVTRKLITRARDVVTHRFKGFLATFMMQRLNITSSVSVFNAVCLIPASVGFKRNSCLIGLGLGFRLTVAKLFRLDVSVELIRLGWVHVSSRYSLFNSQFSQDILKFE